MRGVRKHRSTGTHVQEEKWRTVDFRIGGRVTEWSPRVVRPPPSHADISARIHARAHTPQAVREEEK